MLSRKTKAIFYALTGPVMKINSLLKFSCMQRKERIAGVTLPLPVL